MIAYFFWHSDAAGYERDLIAFHRALAAFPPPGFLGSAICFVSGVPWLPEAGGYEDRYLLADFAALGALNEAAVAGPRRGAHDAVASAARGGVGGLYRPRAGTIDGGFRPFRTWIAKPAGMSYTEFDEFLRPLVTPGAVVWQRQLVLGPTPEFCIETGAPIDLVGEALRIEARAVWPGDRIQA
jgi:hypothetical protein